MTLFNRLLLTAALLAIALPVLAGHDDGGTDQPWTNDMNQESYWDNYFGGVCTKFADHSGFIPATYQAAVVKDGNMVRIYEKPGPYTASGAVNPANGSHFAAPHSWVMKCVIETTTTTSTTLGTTTTSTTLRTTTTTEPETSTLDPSTTSTVPSTDTTVSSTSSSPPTSQPPGSTSTTSTISATTELPFTGFGLWGWLYAALVALASGGLLVRVARD